jgi:hypothetical protein
VAKNRQTRNKLKTWALSVGICLIGPAAGLIAGLVTHAGRDVDVKFFELCSQIAPILAVALFIEIALVMGSVIERQGLTEANIGTGLVLVRSNTGLFMVSEGLALFAVACSKRTTFLEVAVVVPMIIQLYLFLDTTLLKLGIREVRGG